MRCIRGKIFFALLICMVVFVGCQKSEKKQENKDTKITEYSENHISEKLDENIILNANIEKPEKESYNVYPVQGKKFDLKNMEKLFFGTNENLIEEWEEDIPGYNISEKKTNKSLCITEGGLYFLKEDPESCDMEELVEKYIKNNKEQVMKDEEKKKSEQMGEIFLKKIGIRKEQVELNTEVGVTLEDLLALDSQNENLKKQFSNSEKMYYLKYNFKQDGIRIYSYSQEPKIQSVIEEGNFAISSAIVMILDQAGEVQYLEYRECIQSNKNKEIKNEKILSVNEILEIIKNKYTDIIMEQPITITDIYLEYIPIREYKKEANVTLTPYWCIVYSIGSKEAEIYEQIGYQNCFAERINAITGGDLSYGK